MTASVNAGDASGSEDGDVAAFRTVVEAVSAAALEQGYQGALSALARVCVPAFGPWAGVCVRERADAWRLRSSAHARASDAQAIRAAVRAALASADRPSGDEQPGRTDAGDTRPGGPAAALVALLRCGADAPLAGGAPDREAPVEVAVLEGPGNALADALRAGGVREVVVVPVPTLPGAPSASAPDGDASAGDATAVCLLVGRPGPASSGDGPERASARWLREVARTAAGALALAARLDAERQARAESEAARQAVASALLHLPDGFVTVDAAARVTFLNPAAARLLGCSREEAVGRALEALAPAAHWEPVAAAMREAVRRGEPAAAEGACPAGGSNGQSAPGWVDVRAVPTADGLSLYLRDVSARRAADVERHRLFVAAEAARREAEEANKAKAEFLASMSHELRTPLNAILGYVALLADGISGPLTALQARQLGRVTASARHLLALIEEVLVFARLESGRETLHLDDADAATLAREAAELVEPVVESQGLRFDVRVPEAPMPVVTDARKVRQILLNLLANAARFTPPGGTITLRVHEDGDGLTYAVRDTGIGIAAAHQERIFDAFWQVEQHKARRVGGSGLGLSVSRRYARLLGGDVVVASAPGAGSTFTVRLPRRATPVASDDPAGVAP
jgi:PAS domain S-box-containing protein